LLVTAGTVNIYPASMVNFIWFADNKWLKFHHRSHKNHPKQSLSRICGDSLTFVADCSFQQDRALAQRDCEMIEFLACETPDFKLPCCFVLT